ncbi:GntR family transcriptional regulator [Limosilactobacillus pontis]|uniref:GntR family transcriptional regulator n=1 Tax=Limosilactobacillus pontis TaxID=35787 RepID=UPI001D45FDDD|nr:GntR family transcriptional regulator [Limosilactobacillus pontis]HJE26828.1 GntR family transcriptional regulator [Limosilactobacillus pontis]
MISYSRNNLTSKAYDVILQKIISAEYKPGQKISEKKIEEDVNIGRTPVREALLQLRQEKLINVIPQSGTYISKIDLKDVFEARFIRSSIEQRIMCEAAALNITPEQKTAINDIIKEQIQARATDNFPSLLRFDDTFHKYFYRITGHERVWDWLRKVNIQFNRFRFFRLKVQKLSWKGLIEEHQRIANAVLNSDISEIDRLTANHMHRMLDEEKPLIEAFPDYFENAN